MSCGGGCRCGSDPTWLWLWYRPAAKAPFYPRARKPPYVVGAAQKTKKKKKKKKNERKKKRRGAGEGLRGMKNRRRRVGENASIISEDVHIYNIYEKSI